MSVQDFEKKLGLNYYDKIAALLIGEATNPKEALGDNGAIYTCPITFRGLSGGQYINPGVTNNQLYQIADSLLPLNQPVYLPTEGSYFSSLQQYLNYVQLVGDPSNENKLKEKAAIKDSEDKRKKFFKEDNKAGAAYQNSRHSATMDFVTWARAYWPTYFTALQANQAASATLGQIQKEIYGPDAEVLGNLRNAMTAAQGAEAAPGLNMPTILEDVANLHEIFKALKEGRPLPPTKEIKPVLRPTYTLQNFSDTVNGWIDKYPVAKETEIIEFDTKSQSKYSWSDYNFDRVSYDGSASVGWWFFRARADYKRDTQESSSHVKVDESQVSIRVRLTFSAIVSLTIGTGTWDVPNVRRSYPKLRDDVPPGLLTNMVKSERVLIGYGPGLSIEMDSKNYQAVHDSYNKTIKSSASARFSIFGFDIGVGGGTTSERTNTTSSDKVQWDEKNSKITIKPDIDYYPVVLAVLGRRLK